MTLLDSGGGGTGGSGNGGGGGGTTEVTTLTRPVFGHRNGIGSTSNTKKHISPTSFNSDINANNTSITNENFASTLEADRGRNGSEGHIRRVPELCNPLVIPNNERDHVITNGEHDLKKWSELCKMTGSSPNGNGPSAYANSAKRPESSSTGTSSNHGDSNNNHSTTSESGTSTVLPDMDFSN